MTRRTAPLSPLLVVALTALALLTARIAAAQAPSATSAPTRRVAVATRVLPRGTTLTADDFAVRDTVFRGAGDTTSVAPGWVTRRTIAAGEVLRAPAVEAPAVVTANEPVQVEWADHNVVLTVRGIAGRSGAVGDRVPVRTELGKRIEATIVAPGRVRID